MSVEDDPVVLDADEVLDPAAVPLTDREPVIDRLKPAQRELLFRKHAMGEFVPKPHDPNDPDSPRVWRGPNGLDESDIAGMLEVAWLLGLDPFTPGEIWCARSKAKTEGQDPGKLLVMVGRDGRRKIVQRNGLRMRGDVVREHDEFEVWHSDEEGVQFPRIRIRHHIAGAAKARGAVVGSWSEVWNPRTNETRGYFFADVDEYKPDGASAYSPWSHQLSAMIKAASERQSTSEATPLSGLIGEGEAAINQAPDRPVLGGDAAPDSRQLASGDPVPLPSAVWRVMERAAELRHRGLMDQAAWEMRVAGQPEAEVARQVREAHDELDALVLSRTDAGTTVEDADGGAVGVRRSPDAEQVDVTIQKAPLTEPAPPDDEAMAAADEDPNDAQDAIAALERERDAAADPDQSSLLS